MRFFVGFDAICRCDFFGKKGAMRLPSLVITDFFKVWLSHNQFARSQITRPDLPLWYIVKEPGAPLLETCFFFQKNVDIC